MTTKSDSNKRLNEHKIKINTIIRPIEQCLQQLKNINEDYLNINNIVETYNDKVFEISNELEKQGIDFWSNSFPLRDAILIQLRGYLIESYVNLELIVNEIITVPKLALKSKILNNLSMKKLEPKVKRISELEEITKNYEIKDNLREMLEFFYKNIPVETLLPGDAIGLYLQMKENIKQLNLQGDLSKYESKILRVIKVKEEECEENMERIIEVLKTCEELNDNNKDYSRS